MSKQKHTPVLLESVLEYLAPQAGESYLDVTAGYGGHARLILEHTKNYQGATLVDRDPQSVAVLKKEFGVNGTRVIQQDFLSVCRQLAEAGERFDLILADLGISSPHLDQASRGFSFAGDGPLDMRMDSSQDLTAEVIVNSWDEKQIADILSRWGEESKARAIAKAIVRARPLQNTQELANVVAHVWRAPSRKHPATRTFQALRIAVNDELTQLEQSLPLWLKLLAPGGRLAVISFHSLEDRIVKQFFAEHSSSVYDSELELLTKKPIRATTEEIVSNPRARSAKLRVSRKNKNK